MQKIIDFRSDTVTKPTKAMREAMLNAVVGDDVYGDDPTINDLETKVASLLKKEAALFVPSGTMANQLAILAHTNRGDEIIVGSNSHIKNYEVGASAVLASVSYHLVQEVRGMMPLEAIKEGVRGEDIHYPETSLICLENAHGTGVVLPLNYMKSVYTFAKAKHLNVHLDGARLFNAATYLDVDAADIAAQTDSLMFCLSKGLAAPIGSILVGTKDFIKRARKYRKMLGGGLRQVGVLGAPGFIAVDVMRKRLKEDHDNADYLAQKLDKLEGFKVDNTSRDINMVFVKSTHDLSTISQTLEKDNGILLGGYKGDYMRLVTHNDITKDDIDYFIKTLKEML